jgi:hypothetical protein
MSIFFLHRRRKLVVCLEGPLPRSCNALTQGDTLVLRIGTNKYTITEQCHCVCFLSVRVDRGARFAFPSVLLLIRERKKDKWLDLEKFALFQIALYTMEIIS